MFIIFSVFFFDGSPYRGGTGPPKNLNIGFVNAICPDHNFATAIFVYMDRSLTSQSAPQSLSHVI